MTVDLTTRLRVVMVWIPSRGSRDLDLALEWADRLGIDERRGPQVCVWTPRDVRAGSERPDDVRICWHSLDLPPRIDRHVDRPSPRDEVSPWGSKSGPNFQFFRLLDRFGEVHPHDWLLYAEPDTVPIGAEVADAVADLLEANSDAWMIGARPHPIVRARLTPDLWNHLNGAALYHVGDRDFAEFRRSTWIPSMLLKIRELEIYAYDCITDPSQRRKLPERLRHAWRAETHRFVATSGMVNLSTETLDPAGLRSAMEDDMLLAALRAEGTSVWMVHAKGDFRGPVEP